MNNRQQALADLQEHLGYKQLNRTWAKIELFAGLTAAGIGLFLGVWAFRPLEVVWEYTGAGLILFVLGSYLALAGHRSHIYQSNNELTAYLVEELHRSGKG